jgi:hypothetical protein
MKIRFPLAIQGYFRDGWNVVDIINYNTFMSVFIIRVCRIVKNTLDLCPIQFWGAKCPERAMVTRAHAPRQVWSMTLVGPLKEAQAALARGESGIT